MTVDPKELAQPEQVRSLLANAERLGRNDVVAQCIERLAELRAERDGAGSAVETDCWKAIAAAEEAATVQNRRTTRMSRTRQKVDRVGVVKTMADLAGSEKLHQGFAILQADDKLHLSFEFVVLKYPEVFSVSVRQTARHKLIQAGMSEERLPPLNSRDGSPNGQA